MFVSDTPHRCFLVRFSCEAVDYGKCSPEELERFYIFPEEQEKEQDAQEQEAPAPPQQQQRGRDG